MVEELLRTSLMFTDVLSGILDDLPDGAFPGENPAELDLLDLPVRWLVRAAELVGSYTELPLGLVDATVIAAAEMLEETKVATLDRRHFSVVRPAHVTALTLVP